MASEFAIAGALAPRIVLIITLMTACQSPDNFDSAVGGGEAYARA